MSRTQLYLGLLWAVIPCLSAEPYFFHVETCSTRTLDVSYWAGSVERHVLAAIADDSAMVCDGAGCRFQHTYDTTLDTNLEVTYGTTGLYSACIQYSLFDPQNRPLEIRLTLWDYGQTVITADSVWGDLNVTPAESLHIYFTTTDRRASWMLSAFEASVDTPLCRSEQKQIAACAFSDSISIDSARQELAGTWNWAYSLSDPAAATPLVYRSDWSDVGYHKSLNFTPDSFHVYHDETVIDLGPLVLSNAPTSSPCPLGGRGTIKLDRFVLGCDAQSGQVTNVEYFNFMVAGEDVLILTHDSEGGVLTTVYIREGTPYLDKGVTAVRRQHGSNRSPGHLQVSQVQGGLALHYDVARRAAVRVAVLDCRGRHVIGNDERNVNAGSHRVLLSAAQLSPGAYLAVVWVNGRITAATRVALLRRRLELQ